MGALQFHKDNLSFAERLGAKFATSFADENLENEVRNGQSTLTIDPVGQVNRIVTIRLLSITRQSDKKMFVRLGKWNAEERRVDVACKLPGAKVAAGESPKQALSRVLQKLPRDYLTHMHSLREERYFEYANSSAYGIKTKYIKTVQHILFSEDMKFGCYSQDLLHASPSFNATKARDRPGSRQYRGSRRMSMRLPSADSIIAVRGEPDLVYLNAWLDEDEFYYLCSSHGRAALAEWSLRADVLHMVSCELEADMPAIEPMEEDTELRDVMKCPIIADNESHRSSLTEEMPVNVTCPIKREDLYHTTWL